MPDFTYRASVIIPVYNVEKYLRDCIESLLKQTVDFSELEVILVNDGSKDSSAEICKEYAEKYSNIIFYTKENEGLSKTRNLGLTKAHGKYIFFFDSDDMLREDTIKSVCDFFDTVYDEVDLVTYKIVQYYQGRPNIVHYRYMTLNKSGVYDLNAPENRFITQTNVNICVKNLFENNIKFDTTPNFRHEDQKYCCDILRPKMKIGYCDKGEYIYNRNNVNSIVSTQFSPENIFDTSMDYYEELFSYCKGCVAPYFQGMVFNDFRWKLMDNKFLPKHLDGDDWIKANRRIDALLKRMDADTIILHPSLSETDMFYWLKRRGGCTVVNDSSQVLICCEGKIIHKTTSFKASKNNGKVTLKSPVFNFLKKNQVQLKVNGAVADFEMATDCYDKSSREPTSFYPTLTVQDENAKITVEINSIAYDVK